jgi:hypothetical protein
MKDNVADLIKNKVSVASAEQSFEKVTKHLRKLKISN